MRVLVLAAGNDARGDDALGPMLSARLAAMKLPGLTVIDAFQFQVEHALDLAAADMALFIDAHLRQEAPVRLAPVVAAADCGEGSHALSPAQVLAVAARIGVPCPPAWLLSVRGRAFELGEPPSPSAQLALAAGWGLLRALLASPDPDRWRCWADRYAGP
ncbi:MAG: hydrogenase maturation protease [Rhodocyclaceae bacterium]|nr:hydrogenase maturation protease [Rhodocyclaceae bacterium]